MFKKPFSDFCFFWSVSGSSSVEALAQDHRNDVISNSVTIATALVAFYKPEVWWLDPAGGIAIGVYIMIIWLRTGFLTMRMLTGYVAPPDLIKKWTYLAMRHDPKVVAVDTVRGCAFFAKKKTVFLCFFFFLVFFLVFFFFASNFSHPWIVRYHTSEGFIVELDIVLPEDMPLKEAHDIGRGTTVQG